MNSKKRIFAFHLLNDRSGSPKVLRQHVQNWIAQKHEVYLCTNQHTEGFLSDIPGVHYIRIHYAFQKNQWLRLVYYMVSQLILVLKMWTKIKKEDIVYINTVLPFGAAITGKIKKANVIYHIHESTVNPPVLRWFLLKVVKLTADKIINVSKYVQQSHGIHTIPNELVYNSMEESYYERVSEKPVSVDPRNVLMVCSLKSYKGLFEFVQLAHDHPEYHFRLVLNATRPEIDYFFTDYLLPENLDIFSSQKDLHAFYSWADVIVNLSRPDGWVETFGLTILEGMAYGLPAIVPPVGGILEVIEEGVSGYSADCRDSTALNNTLSEILKNHSKYKEMSEAAKIRADFFKVKSISIA